MKHGLVYVPSTVALAFAGAVSPMCTAGPWTHPGEVALSAAICAIWPVLFFLASQHTYTAWANDTLIALLALAIPDVHRNATAGFRYIGFIEAARWIGYGVIAILVITAIYSVAINHWRLFKPPRGPLQ